VHEALTRASGPRQYGRRTHGQRRPHDIQGFQGRIAKAGSGLEADTSAEETHEEIGISRRDRLPAMPEENYVPFEIFNTTVKMLISRILDLTVNVLALRAALMQAKQVPVSEEEMERLNELFHDHQPIREIREALLTEPNTQQELIQFLKDFEGTIQ
jgi:hypothetical protein